MTVLVTGGAGYIGCWACYHLLKAGHDVVVVDKGFFPSGMQYITTTLKLPVIEADIRDFNLKQTSEVDAILHLAGLSNDPSAQYHPKGNHEMNTVATERLCAEASAIGCKRFIFASSASVYGYNNQPKLDELAPINPQSYYAESKAAAEPFVLAVGGTVLRQATVMGWSPRHRNDLVVNTMMKSALQTGKIHVVGGGEACRPLVEVRDLAECYVRLLAVDPQKINSVFNVNHRRSTDTIIEGYTVSGLALWMKHLLQKNHGIAVDVVGNWDTTEARSYDMTSAKLRRLLDWEPQRGITAAVVSIFAHKDQLNSYDQINIEWLKALEYGQSVTQKTGSVFVP